MSAFSIIARAGDSRARAGVLTTAHGKVRTPAFVPLASTASVRGLAPAEVAAIGYDIVLGNTFHLFLRPGGELIEELGGLHRFMGWERAIVTDSGGFQVFSMGHGTVADEIKGRRGGGRGGAILAIEEDGVRFRSYIDGSERFMAPETSMEVQHQLGSDIVLAFDECTPFNVERDYTERSTQRTHRWLERCVRWRAQHEADQRSLFYGIVQGGVYADLRAQSIAAILASGCEGVAIGGSLGREKEQMYEVVEWCTGALQAAPERPRHLLGIGEVDDLIRGVELGIDSFDCAMPTRLARHGVALVPDPANRWRLELDRPAWRTSREPLLEGCPCQACAGGLSRAYLHYLARGGELTGARLLTEHNLTFIARLMADLRGAIVAGRLGEVAAALRGGASPAGG